MKLLYSADIQEETISEPEKKIEEYKNFFISLNQEEKEFISKIISKVFQEKTKIDLMIKDHLIGWQLGRLTPIDRNLLRMGIAEMYYNEEKAIIIDDIIRISKKYSEKDSFKIINAILDKVTL